MPQPSTGGSRGAPAPPHTGIGPNSPQGNIPHVTFPAARDPGLARAGPARTATAPSRTSLNAHPGPRPCRPSPHSDNPLQDAATLLCFEGQIRHRARSLTRHSLQSGANQGACPHGICPRGATPPTECYNLALSYRAKFTPGPHPSRDLPRRSCSHRACTCRPSPHSHRPPEATRLTLFRSATRRKPPTRLTVTPRHSAPRLPTSCREVEMRSCWWVGPGSKPPSLPERPPAEGGLETKPFESRY